MNYKEQFKSWISNNLTKDTGAVSSYISCIDWLSDRYFEKSKINKKSIFEIEDVEVISDFILRLRKYSEIKNRSFITKMHLLMEKDISILQV